MICEFSEERNYVQLRDNMTVYVSWFKVVLKRKENLPLPGKMSNHLKWCRISSIILTDLQTSYPLAISSLYPLISIYTSERDKRYWNDLISHKTLQNLPLMFVCLFGNSWNHLPKTVGICLFNRKLGGSLMGDRIYFQAHTTSCAWGGYVGMFFSCLSSNIWYCWNGYFLRIYMC